MFCFVRSIKLCKLRITAASQTQKITAMHWSCNHHLGQKQHRLWENFTFEDRVLCEEINLPMPKLVLNIKNFNSKHSIAKIITLAVTTILHISLPFALQYFSQRHSVGSIPQKANSTIYFNNADATRAQINKYKRTFNTILVIMKTSRNKFSPEKACIMRIKLNINLPGTLLAEIAEKLTAGLRQNRVGYFHWSIDRVEFNTFYQFESNPK